MWYHIYLLVFVCSSKENKIYCTALNTYFYSDTCFEDIIKAFLEECALMKSFKHPNVFGLVGMCLNSPNGVPLMVLPFMANGNLKKYLQQARRYERIDQ